MSNEDPEDVGLENGRGHHAQSNADAKPHWPPGVRPISIDGLDELGVGNDGRIYWQGRPIEVQQSVTLTAAQRLGAVVVALSAIVGAAAAAVSAYADLASLR